MQVEGFGRGGSKIQGLTSTCLASAWATGEPLLAAVKDRYHAWVRLAFPAWPIPLS